MLIILIFSPGRPIPLNGWSRPFQSRQDSIRRSGRIIRAMLRPGLTSHPNGPCPTVRFIVFSLEVQAERDAARQLTLSLPALVGRDPACDLVLPSWRIAKQHASFLERAGAVYVQDHGSLTGVLLNGRRVYDDGPLRVGDMLSMAGFVLHVQSVPVCVAPQDDQAAFTASDVAAADSLPSAQDTVFRQEQQRLHQALLESLQLERRDLSRLSDQQLYQEAHERVGKLIRAQCALAAGDQPALQAAVCAEAVGFGALEPLLADPDISEIMVNHHGCVFVERHGRLHRHGASFSSEAALRAVIDRILAPLGRRLDVSSPAVDGRLPDGSRFHAVLAPVAVKGTCVTIRKFPHRRLALRDLLQSDSLSADMAAFLGQAVAMRCNILVSGGTGTGKTTLLNVLSTCIDAGERIVTLEDAAELQLQHANWVSLESRPANAEGQGQVDIRSLLRQALRMRPDRIIVGECRGAEAFDMLSAMNTGHEGSMGTLHANSPRDALSRLEGMVLMSGLELPLNVVREHIARALHVLVQLSRLPDGRRVVSEVVEVTGMEGNSVQLQSLYSYRPSMGFVGSGLVSERVRAHKGLA